MSINLKPFQHATVDAACRTLRNDGGARRFLVADEVGLGKTVVAREIVRRLAEGRKGSLVVFYIANGQRVASQNRGRLVDFLPKAERARALSRADRIGLIPMTERPEAPIALYALTPKTSFPGQRATLSEGRKEERAFIAALLGLAFPDLHETLGADFLQAPAKTYWRNLVDRQRERLGRASGPLVRAFSKAMRMDFGGNPLTTVPAAILNSSRRKVIGRMRRALSHAALLSTPPDLVIFDEFQRYRHLLSPEGRQDRLVETLFAGPGECRAPAVLLLSATPYRLLASRWEESRGVAAHHELFDLIEFLGGAAGSEIRRHAEEAFGAFGTRLRTIASAPAGADLGVTIAKARQYRHSLQTLLAPLMSRTEREAGAVRDGSETIPLKADLAPADVRAFRHLTMAFKPRHKADALAYWLSIPLPAQALGNRYEAARQAVWPKDGKLFKLTQANRKRIEPPPQWPHPKLRALKAVAPPESLALPWAAPSLPWWPLRGPWRDTCPPEKLLVFSRFRATPQSVAALTSFEVEAATLRRLGVGYDKAWRTRKLQAAPGRLPVVALFHPSPFLIQAADPVPCARAKTMRGIRNGVRRQLRQALSDLGIEVHDRTARERNRRHPTWSLMAALDRRYGADNLSAAAWQQAAAQDARLAALVKRWHKAELIDWISPRELDDLTEAALSYPGVVIGRALLRHFNKAMVAPHFADMVRLSWNGLRPYLDNPVFWSRFKGNNSTEALTAAVVDGGFEALLDEHFWILKRASAQGGADIAGRLQAALTVKSGWFSLRTVGTADNRHIRLRCHAAVPFGGTEEALETLDGAASERPARSDELRNAFNSPFWPHLLATTSVGQEGLDFHTWCAGVAHWDLCASPLDLEQREGRIQRFGGLLVRRRLAEELGPKLLAAHQAKHRSVWDEISTLADRSHSDRTGLGPWWLLPDAGVRRYVFALPHGRDVARLRRLHEQRFIYRLALGQPNQEDLIEMLTDATPERREVLKSLALNLSAFTRDMIEAESRQEADEIPEVDAQMPTVE